MTGAEVFQRFLETYDVSHVFGNPGTTETTLLEAIASRPATEYVLALQESSAVGIAAGFACVTNRPAVVNVHTYPGVANALCNTYNALCSGIPLLVLSGQQDRRHLLHNPVLSGNLTGLASTAVKYALEVQRIEDLAVALQRCYVQAALPPAGPTFLSLPMDLMAEVTDTCHFKPTAVLADSVPSLDLLRQTLEEAGRLAFVADYQAGDAIDELGALADYLEADLYSSPFHVRGVVEPRHPRYRGQLPAKSGEVRRTLSQYDTLVLLGEKIDVFLFSEANAMPPSVKLVQISPSPGHLSFDFPCDLAVLGNVRATLRGLMEIWKVEPQPLTPPLEAPAPGLIGEILGAVDRNVRLVTEGGSQDAAVQRAALALGFRNVHFSPRGGGLGWAMPLAVGLSLGSGQPSVCFVGDGGSLYAIHCLWTAARYRVPVLFVCFVNREYRLLKDLWAGMKGGPPERYIGLDFADPPLDMGAIATGFGARALSWEGPEQVREALAHPGPTFLTVA